MNQQLLPTYWCCIIKRFLYLNAPNPNASAILDVGRTSALKYYSYLNGLRLSGRDISIYHNVPNNDLTFHTNWGSTTGGNIGFYTRSAATRLTIDGGSGNISCSNAVSIAGVVHANGDKLNFVNTLNQ